jgi:hypothetical protein
MNADTLEYVAKMIREIDTASTLQLDGRADVWENDELLGTVVFNGETETTFEAARS